VMIRCPPGATRFPYTTLFRSESGEVRETHHFATIIGYGAAAVNPYLAIETLQELRDQGVVDPLMSNEKLFAKYAKAINGGLLKRSEEHTSELQSRENLVCRLL